MCYCIFTHRLNSKKFYGITLKDGSTKLTTAHKNARPAQPLVMEVEEVDYGQVCKKDRHLDPVLECKPTHPISYDCVG